MEKPIQYGEFIELDSDKLQPLSRGKLSSMEAFISLGPRHGILTFILKGPKGVSTTMDALVGLYPKTDPSVEDGWSILEVNPNASYDRGQIHQMILSVEIPERVKKVGIQADQQIYTRLRGAMASVGFPSVLLVFGHAKDTAEEVVILYAVSGLAPEEALAKIQGRAQERAASLQ